MKAHNPRPFFRYEKNQFIVTGGGLLFSIHVMEEGQQLDTCEVSTRGTCTRNLSYREVGAKASSVIENPIEPIGAPSGVL